MERRTGRPHSEEFRFEGSRSYVKQRLAIDSLAERMDRALGPFCALPNAALLAIVCVLALKERIFTNGNKRRVITHKGKSPPELTS